jgi:hypothetical protein
MLHISGAETCYRTCQFILFCKMEAFKKVGILTIGTIYKSIPNINYYLSIHTVITATLSQRKKYYLTVKLCVTRIVIPWCTTKLLYTCTHCFTCITNVFIIKCQLFFNVWRLLSLVRSPQKTFITIAWCLQ